MWVRKSFEKLKTSRYYNINNFDSNYKENSDLSVFIIMVENINIDQIRYIEKKELLRVLEYIFEKYRFYLIKSSYLEWYSFINNYCSFSISEREYIILEYILRLKEQLGWYYMKHYNIYYNIALDYLSKYKNYNHFHNKYHNKKDNPYDKTKPSFHNFPWEFICNKYGFIDKKCFKDIVK